MFAPVIAALDDQLQVPNSTDLVVAGLVARWGAVLLDVFGPDRKAQCPVFTSVTRTTAYIREGLPSSKSFSAVRQTCGRCAC